MSDELRELLNASKGVGMTAADSEEQRISFAYGNTHFENERITRDDVRQASQGLKHGTEDGCSEG